MSALFLISVQLIPHNTIHVRVIVPDAPGASSGIKNEYWFGPLKLYGREAEKNCNTGDGHRSLITIFVPVSLPLFI